MSRLKRWAGAVAKKVRGVLGLSLIGGVFSALAGAVIGTVFVIAEFGAPTSGYVLSILADFMTQVTPLFFVAGAATSGAFATLLATTSGGRTLADLTYRRVALMGAVVGVLLPMSFIVAEAGFALLIDVFVDALPAFGVFGATGAVLSTTLVGLAKRAEKRELKEGERGIAELEAGSV